LAKKLHSSRGGRKDFMPKSFYFAGWLVDGTGTPAKQNVLICVENGAISSLDSANLEELKTSGHAVEAYPACTILPGLIDCHVHLTMSGKIDQNLRFRQLLHEFAQNSPLIGERIDRSFSFGIMALRDGGDIGGHTLMYVRQNGSPRVRVKCAGTAWRASGRYGKMLGRNSAERLDPSSPGMNSQRLFRLRAISGERPWCTQTGGCLSGSRSRRDAIQ
jgi:hypothetical protein